MPGTALEIATDSPADALGALELGADALELCSNLASSGLSADPALVRELKLAGTPEVVALARPSLDDALSPAGFLSLCRDAGSLLDAGADALAFGVLRRDHTIDRDRTAELVRLCAGRTSVFHRAFDSAPSPADSLRLLADLGVRRVLASGSPLNAPAPALETRLATLHTLSLVADSAGILLIPSGGLRAHNARLFRAALPTCTRFHSACRSPQGAFDLAEVRALAQALRG